MKLQNKKKSSIGIRLHQVHLGARNASSEIFFLLQLKRKISSVNTVLPANNKSPFSVNEVNK